MTPEGHQPADRASDTTSPARGDRSSSFGLFEAPEVPDEFATFTPSRHAGSAPSFPRFGEPDQAPAAGGEQGYGEAEPQRIPDDPGYSPSGSGFSGFPRTRSTSRPAAASMCPRRLSCRSPIRPCPTRK